MGINCPVITANPLHDHFPLASAAAQRQPFQWLLELEIDGTIRYSNLNPQGALTDRKTPAIGSNFFELPEIGELRSFKREFAAFVKGNRNRQTFSLPTGNGLYDSRTVVVLTRSFDKTEAGPSTEVVLMELKRI